MRKFEVGLSFGGNADFDLIEAAAMFVAGGVKSVDTSRSGFEIKAVSEPSVAETCRSVESVPRFSAEDYRRMRFLPRPRLLANPIKGEKASPEVRALH